MLQRARKRLLTVLRPIADTPGYAFEAVGTEIEARVLPMSGTLTVQMYGALPSQMLMLLAPPGTDIREGDGLRVGAGSDENPDYRVVYTARWSRHIAAHLQLIPEHERGADI